MKYKSKKRSTPISTMRRARAFNLYLIILSAVPLLSMDLYLPSLPQIANYYNTTYNMANLTMVAFTFTMAICALFWGPISDKYGRKPIVICGTILYLSGALLCALAPSIQLLIVFRILQALGSSSATVIVPAIIRDIYDVGQQEKILSLVFGLTLLWPAVAPSIGAFILIVFDWRGIFIAMAFMGAVLLVGIIPVKETLKKPLTVSVWKTFPRLLTLLSNKRFAALIIIFALPSIPLMAYITASSYIYQIRFGLSEQEFGLFFAASALAMMAGSFAYYKTSRGLGRTPVAYLSFTAVLAGGIGVLLVGGISPWVLVALMAFVAFFTSLGGPLRVFLALNNQAGDTGSASSLQNAISTLFMCAGISSLALFNDYLTGVGILLTIFGIASVSLFAIVFKKV